MYLEEQSLGSCKRLSLSGVLTHDVEIFGNSWMEAQPHEAPCPMVPSGFSSPCAAVDTQNLLVGDRIGSAGFFFKHKYPPTLKQQIQ